MPITFFPKAGMVLSCDFEGYKHPEIVKKRPVVVISPNSLTRPSLVTVIPLSTTPPNPVWPYHYLLPANPFPKSTIDSWAKCDMIATVNVARLDRIQLVRRGPYETYYVGMDIVRELRRRAALSFGLDISTE
ncbi:MAG: type II toxin-antitoxin system PemK/MazF family toxin [Burkholderiales bacterium]|nr:type II toxin-antitoxin system PemK/MazF family toxin [Burkholderiales bacterium]